ELRVDLLQGHADYRNQLVFDMNRDRDVHLVGINHVGAHGARKLVAQDLEHSLVVANRTADNIQALALRAVQERAAIGLAGALHAGRHGLREHANAATAIERHADFTIRTAAGKIADEFGALVFSGYDFARPRPLAGNLPE